MFGGQQKGRGIIPYLYNLRRHFRASKKGQGLVEYALIMVLVSLMATILLTILGPSIKDVYCNALNTLDPDSGESCLGSYGPDVMFAKFDAKKGELDIMAKAPEDCEEDLIVEGLGTMIRQGSSYVFKKTISASSPPLEVKIGHDNCGWTKQTVE